MSANISTTADPIAIIGIGCRLPGGGQGPTAVWQLLENRVRAMSERPGDGWNM